MRRKAKYPKRMIMSYLREQIKKGNFWVVCQGYDLPVASFELKAFDSSLRAEKFCSDNQFATDKEDGSIVELIFQYHATENLLEEYRYLCRKHTVKALHDPVIIKQLLKEQSIQIEEDSDLGDQMLCELAYGRIVPALREITIVPVERAIAYLLILDQHQYHPIFYELGHSVTVLASFSTLREAETAFKKHADGLPTGPPADMTTLSLVCSFQQGPLPLGFEGDPQFNCGTVLASANYDGAEVSFEQQRDAGQPLEAYQRFFIKVDKDCQRILMLDDCLKEISDPDSIRSCWDSGYHAILGKERITSFR